MGKSIAKNYIYNMLYQTLVIVTPILTTPYVSRILGAEGVGQYDMTQATVQYFILLGTAGLHLYGRQEIAYVQDDRQKRSKVFFEISALKLAAMTVSMTVYLIFTAYSGNYRILYLIQTADLLAALADMSWFCYGIEEFKTITVRNMGVRLAGVAAVFLFIRTPADVPFYVMAHSVPALLGNLSMLGYVKKYIDFGAWKSLELKKHLRPALEMFLPEIAVQVYVVMDKTMIMLLTGQEAEVGYYGQAQRMIKLILTVVTAICTVMNPRISFAFAKKDYPRIRYYMERSFGFAYLLAVPMTLGVLAISGWFVPLFFGGGYEKVVPLMRLMSPIILFISFSNIIGFQYLLPSKRRTKYTVSIVAGALVNLCLNCLMIPLWQSIGATIATVAAEFTVLSVQLWEIRKEFSVKEILLQSRKYLIAGAVMFSGIWMLYEIWWKGSALELLQIPAGIILYFGLLACMKEEMTGILWKKITSLWKQR